LTAIFVSGGKGPNHREDNPNKNIKKGIKMISEEKRTRNNPEKKKKLHPHSLMGGEKEKYKKKKSGFKGRGN